MNVNLSPHKITTFIYNKQIKEKDVLTSNLLEINFYSKIKTFYYLHSQGLSFIIVSYTKLLNNVTSAVRGEIKTYI